MTTEPGTTVATQDAYDGTAIPGLEDFDPTDQVVPRIKIDHKNAKYVDTLTNEAHDTLDVILLGLVKQRILWDVEVDDDAKPMCKSFDHQFGVPGGDFPWKASGFRSLDFENVDQPRLDCGSCKLKDWGSHPHREAPWCSEQYVIPLIMQLGDGGAAPAIITFQRGAIKPVKAFVAGFARTRSPLFTAFTKLTLDARKRGAVDFAVPILTKGDATDEAGHPEFIQTFFGIRDYLQTERSAKTDDTGGGNGGGGAGAPAAQAEPPAKPSGDDGDDIPF